MDLGVRITQTDAKRRLTDPGSEPAAARVIDPDEECNQQHSRNKEKEGEVASFHPSVRMPFCSRTGRSGLQMRMESRILFLADGRDGLSVLCVLQQNETVVNSSRSDTFGLHPSS